MIRPEGFRGAAFGTSEDGDAKRHPEARTRIAAELGVTDTWAFVRQVHGATMLQADGGGVLGDADAMYTTIRGLPLGIATADCLPIVLEGPAAVATVHAGWRGLSAGVIERTLQSLREASLTVDKAAIGPSIGQCCYEVGPEVAERFPAHVGLTTWGTQSVDLGRAAEHQLAGLAVWRSAECTMCSDGFNSYRRDRTGARQVAVGWLPTN